MKFMEGFDYQKLS